MILRDRIHKYALFAFFSIAKFYDRLCDVFQNKYNLAISGMKLQSIIKEILMALGSISSLRFFIGFFLLLFSLFANTNEFDYEFHWSFIPVAKLSIKFNESLSQSNTNFSDVEFEIFTDKHI